MTRIVVTILLIVAWHFPTTYFVPQDPPNDHGWFLWPFGRASSPVVHAFEGALAPSSPTALPRRRSRLSPPGWPLSRS